MLDPCFVFSSVSTFFLSAQQKHHIKSRYSFALVSSQFMGHKLCLQSIIFVLCTIIATKSPLGFPKLSRSGAFCSRSAGRRCPARLLLAAGLGGLGGGGWAALSWTRRALSCSWTRSTRRMGCSGETAWLSSYLPLAWAGHVCLGLAMGILGPTQPFLATQVNNLLI